MVIVVECKCCMTEYRLNEALLKGAKGACIRCPKCRERIIVENPQAATPAAPPQMPSPTPPVAVETGTSSIRDATPREMTTLGPLVRSVEGSDLSDRILPEPVVGVDDGIAVSPTPNTAPDPPDIPGRKALRLNELSLHPAALEGDRIPGGGKDGSMAIRSPGTGRSPHLRRTWCQRPLFLAAAIAFLLVTGGALYFVDGNSGRTSPDIVLSARARSVPENAVFEVGNLKGNLDRQASGTPVYVVKGTVTNVGKAMSSGIRIKAILLGKDNEALAVKAVFAGNPLDEALMRHMGREEIERFMSTPLGEGNVNKEIPPGKALPFMVIFFDPPINVDAVVVKAIDAEEADRIGSTEGGGSGTRASNPQPIRPN